MDLALRDIRRHLGKFFATIAGVGMLLAIVLVMNGIYRGNIFDGIWLIENTAADLWVVELGRGGPFNESSRLPGDAHKSVAATPGVARASPFISYAAQRELAGTSQQFTVIGYDVFGGLGGPGRLVAGRRIEAAHWEAVADARLGLALGDAFSLGSHSYTVVGLTRGAVDPAGNPVVYLSLPDAQEVLYQQDSHALVAARAASARRLERAGYSSAEATKLLPLLAGSTATVNAVLVQLSPGHDSDTVKKHVERWLHFSAYTTAEERDLMLEGRLKKMSAVLGLFRSLLVVVSIVIIALIVYVLTIEKIRPIATLKLIGAPNHVIVRMILEQSLALTLGSFVVAYALMSLARDRFPRTLILLPEEIAITFAVMLAGGVLASFMAIWHALRTPPSLALGS
ncbi:MAG TPA: ABC transporter permease [Burkholderiales bacterium]